ncbi:MAG: hypothetical protein KDD51_04885 [Bdellovibrionales bacterium]|nr:hypothetical protein [Bdellovibrionales bacterium]
MKQGSWLGYFAVLLLITPPLMAENRVGGGAPVKTPPGYGVQVFDDAIFQDTGKKTTEETSESSVTGTKRYVNGEFGQYNEQQVQQWRQSCAGEAANPSAYSECVRRERSRSTEILKETEKNVESRQNSPLRRKSTTPGVGDF